MRAYGLGTSTSQDDRREPRDRVALAVTGAPSRYGRQRSSATGSMENKMIEMIEKMTGLYPCAEACEWLATQPDLEAAWATCPRGEWLLWMAARVGADRRVLVLAACDGVATALGCEPGEELGAIARLIRERDNLARRPTVKAHKAALREIETQRRRADAAHGRLNRYGT